MAPAPHARLRGVALAAVLAAACADGGDRPRSAVLITLDTTRRDALGAYADRPGLTPALDRIASESLVFDAARTTLPLTLPAHASMLTGLYPPQHTVRGNGPEILPASAVTLAERARERGFETAAFVAALPVHRKFGLDQGFDVYDQPELVPDPDLLLTRRSCEEVLDSVRAWLLARDPSKPCFLWIHFFDAHFPYEPPEEFLRRADGDPYLGEVARVDHAIGELRADLEHAGIFDDALLVVVADHGESRGEHGEFQHGAFCYDTTMRVPFMIRDPGGHRAGEREPALVTVADVFPTILEALDLGPPGAVDGASLFRRPPPEGRGVYFESFHGWASYGWSPLVGWAEDGLKYIHSSRPELYAPPDDPEEQANLVAQRDVAPWNAAIARVLAAPALETERRTVGADVIAAIAALGYAGHEQVLDYPDPFSPELAELPAGRECAEEHELFLRASRAMLAGRAAEAGELYAAVVARNPRHPMALIGLARALMQRGDWSGAAELLQRRLAIPPERVAIHRDLARCYDELGDTEERDRHAVRALELLVEIHTLHGELEEAEQYRRLLEQALAR